MGEARLMNKLKLKLKCVGNERGGIEMMIFSLIAMIFCVIFLAAVLDYIKLYTTQNKLKNDLNIAVHAASLSINKLQLSEGYFKLDVTTPRYRTQDMFYRYLRSNMGLDSSNIALSNSIIPKNAEVKVNELVYVDWEEKSIVNLSTSPTSCTLNSVDSKVVCAVTLNSGSSKEISRSIDQTVVGPSVVAIISTEYDGIGFFSNETLLIPAVQEVYFRK